MALGMMDALDACNIRNRYGLKLCISINSSAMLTCFVYSRNG